jgi:hypothetical protein
MCLFEAVRTNGIKGRGKVLYQSYEGKRDRAILSVRLYHGLRREDLCTLCSDRTSTQKHERSGVLIKTTLETDNLRLGTDERLELNCESDLNAVVTIEQANTKGKFTCTALGDVTPPAKVAMALTGNKPQTVPRVDQYLKAAERRLSSHLSRTLRILMWRA